MSATPLHQRSFAAILKAFGFVRMPAPQLDDRQCFMRPDNKAVYAEAINYGRFTCCYLYGGSGSNEFSDEPEDKARLVEALQRRFPATTETPQPERGRE